MLWTLVVTLPLSLARVGLFKGSLVLDAFQVHRSMKIVDVLRSMLGMEDLKPSSSLASMSSLCSTGVVIAASRSSVA